MIMFLTDQPNSFDMISLFSIRISEHSRRALMPWNPVFQ